MDEKDSNPLHNARMEALWCVVHAQKQKLDHFDRLGQIIVDLAQLKGSANTDCEEKGNLPEDVPRDRPNPSPIPEFDEILIYDVRFSKKRVINWLTKLEA